MRNWIVLCETVDDTVPFTYHLWDAVAAGEYGFYWEEGGCWGMALALHDEFAAMGLPAQLLVTHSFVHAMARVGDAVYDWNGRIEPPADGSVVSEQELIEAAIHYGFDEGQIEADRREAAALIENAKELMGAENNS